MGAQGSREPRDPDSCLVPLGDEASMREEDGESL